MAPRKLVIKPTKAGRACPQEVTVRHILPKLPSLFIRTQGRAFGPQEFRQWLRSEKSLQKCKLPSVQQTGHLLAALLRTGVAGQSLGDDEASGKSDDSEGSRRIWQRTGWSYIDPEGYASVSNVQGYTVKQHGSCKKISWHEYGYVFQLLRAKPRSRQSFTVARINAYKALGSIVSKSHVKVKVGTSQALWRSVVQLDPYRGNVGRVEPQWTLIYLHSFSQKGADYLEFPHYFGISEAAVRVVIPTAPQLEQECFKHWKVWRGNTLGWRRIKFNAWFDYATDHCGRCENEINVDSLLVMRARLHALIKHEVQRIGGDSRRVIIGGASQGCCVALDAALTYPEELGGVIGNIGHVLKSTPLDTPHKSVPLYLFHETNDGEMKWRWVKGTVDKLIAAGFKVISKREAEPGCGGHWIQDIEAKWICSGLRQIVAGDSKRA